MLRVNSKGVTHTAMAIGTAMNRPASSSIAKPTSDAPNAEASGDPNASIPLATPFCASGISSAMIAASGASNALIAS